MQRETATPRKIALLATGDEIIQGDILNSNSQEIALRLVEEGMHVRLHAAVRDNVQEIAHAMQFLLQSHQAIIITGGLGPTSDDLTRYAVSEVTNHPLIFDEASWQTICDRLKKFGYPTPPESNRQQALFPAGATIIPNANGTAAGCITKLGEQFIFMLPGPPTECLSMVENVVIPTLKSHHFQQASYRKKWLLFGVSEGKIAEELDAIAKPFACITGYRLWHPYLEFKIFSNQSDHFEELSKLVEKAIVPYVLGNGMQTASSQLREALADSQQRITIQDYATGGALEAALNTPATYHALDFHPQVNPQITINGLENYWQNRHDTMETQVDIQFRDHPASRFQRTIPLRGKRVIAYAVELISSSLYHILFESDVTNATS